MTTTTTRDPTRPATPATRQQLQRLLEQLAQELQYTPAQQTLAAALTLNAQCGADQHGRLLTRTRPDAPWTALTDRQLHTVCDALHVLACAQITGTQLHALHAQSPDTQTFWRAHALPMAALHARNQPLPATTDLAKELTA